MTNKTVELRMLNGVRNDVDLERFDRDENGRRTGFVGVVVGIILGIILADLKRSG